MNPQLNNPQPPVRCYNPVQVLWTDVECEYLLNQRMARNEEYWNSSRGERTRFWRTIARKINNIFGTQFTGEQVSIKWKNLRQDHVVSIFYVNYTGQKVQNQAPIRHQSVINQVPDWCLIGIFDKI